MRSELQVFLIRQYFCLFAWLYVLQVSLKYTRATFFLLKFYIKDSSHGVTNKYVQDFLYPCWYPDMTPWLTFTCLYSCTHDISMGHHSKHFWRDEYLMQSHGSSSNRHVNISLISITLWMAVLQLKGMYVYVQDHTGVGFFDVSSQRLLDWQRRFNLSNCRLVFRWNLAFICND